MKVQCDVCNYAAATLLCCADEAALCTECDIRVHAANKLAGKHERLPLTVHQPAPSSCDICQEKSGLFFCVEDRAILCRDCDVSIHTANQLTRKHKRLLVTGVKVGLDAMISPSLPSQAPSSESSMMVGLDTMDLASSSILPFSLENKNKTTYKTDCVAMETTHHREPIPSPLQSRSNDPCNLTNIAMVESTPHMVPSVSLSQPSILGPTTNHLTPHSQHASSSSMYILNCLAHLDELLNASPARMISNEGPSVMSTSNVGWGALESAFTSDVLHVSTNLFEDSCAEVPSTPFTAHQPCLQEVNIMKRKRHGMDEPMYHTLYNPSVVPNNMLPPYKQSRLSM